MHSVSVDGDVCGAPLSFAAGRIVAVCRYCYATSRLVGDPSVPSGGRASLVREVPKEVGRQIVDLVIDARRIAAIGLLARHSGLNLSQAAQCLDETLGQSVIGYSRAAPPGCPAPLQLQAWGKPHPRRVQRGKRSGVPDVSGTSSWDLGALAQAKGYSLQNDVGRARVATRRGHDAPTP
jgi:hypothetical protein